MSQRTHHQSFIILLIALPVLAWAQIPDSLFLTTDGEVFALEKADHILYVGGSFTTAGFEAPGLAGFQPASDGFDLRFPAVEGTVRRILPDGAGGYFIGGSFSKVGETDIRNLARIRSDLSLDAAFRPEPDGEVNDLRLEGGHLYVGGRFNQIDGQAAAFLARLQVAGGALDPSWRPTCDNAVHELIVDQQRVYVAGAFRQVNGVPQTGFAVLDRTDGSTVFSPSPDGEVTALEQDADRIYLGGRFGGGGYRVGAAALLGPDDLQPVPGFPHIEGNVSEIIGDGAGGWYVAGNFEQVGQTPVRNLAHIRSDFSVDATFQPEPDGEVVAMALTDDHLYLGGAFRQLGGESMPHLARIDLSTQAVDRSWKPEPDQQVQDLAVDAERAYVGGNFTSIGEAPRLRLAAVNLTDGKADETFIADASGIVYALALREDQLFVGGNFLQLGDPSAAAYFAILDKTTGTVADLNLQVGGSVLAVALSGDDLYLGGSFTAVNGERRMRAAKFDLNTRTLYAWSPQFNNGVTELVVSADRVHALGAFSRVNERELPGHAALDPNSGALTDWQLLANDRVEAISVDAEQRLLAGGRFSFLDYRLRNGFLALEKNSLRIDDTELNFRASGFTPLADLEVSGGTLYAAGSFTEVDGQARDGLVQIDLEQKAITDWAPRVEGSISKLAANGDALYLAGAFSEVNETPRRFLAALDQEEGNLVAWDPSPDNEVTGLTVEGGGVIAGGRFGFVKSRTRSNLLAFDLERMRITDWDPAPSSTVRDLLLEEEGLFAAGEFTFIGGVFRDFVALLDPATAEVDPLDAGLSSEYFGSRVNTLAREGGTLYLGGEFTLPGDPQPIHLGALDLGSPDRLAWVLGFEGGEVFDLDVSGRALYAGGNFFRVNGQERPNLLRVDAQTGSLDDWSPAPNGFVYSLDLTPDLLYVGGGFQRIGGQRRNGLAALDLETGSATVWDPLPDADVRALQVRGNQVYIGGFFSQVGDTFSPFYAQVTTAGLARPNLPILNGNVRSLLVDEDHWFLAGPFTSLGGIPSRGLAALRVSETAVEATLERIVPAQGGNTGEVSIQLYGSGFEDDLTVRLTRAGEDDIVLPDTAFQVLDGIRIEGFFDLTGAALGKWDVVVDLPSLGSSLTLPEGFEVVAGVEADPYVEILGFDRIRAMRWQRYALAVGNNGTVDATGVPVYLAIPRDMDIAFDFPIVQAEGDETRLADTLVLTVPVDTLFGRAYPDYEVYPLMVRRIPPGEVLTFNFQVRVALFSEDNQILAWNDPPLFASPLSPGWAACVDDLFSTIIGLTPLGCPYGIFRAGIDPLIKARVSDLNGEQVSASGVLFDFGFGMSMAALGCIVPGASERGAVRAAFKVAFETAGDFNTANSLLGSCFPVPNLNALGLRTINAFDPNDKLGPQGKGLEKYIPGNRKVPYLIRFENLETATAAAQIVRIQDTLDQRVFDISSLELGYITFGEQTVNVPSGLQAFTTDVDLRPEQDIIVRIEAGLEAGSGVLSWTFTALDPATMELVEDPEAGFLPPNVNPPEGDGGVFYTVRLKEGLPFGEDIRNQAFIYFDNNPVIPTPVYRNTIDNELPDSRVLPFPDMPSPSSALEVRWTGVDEGSGIVGYDIFYAVDGGPYERWLRQVADTVAVLEAEPNRTYAFYSVAVDSAGNREFAPMDPDAELLFIISDIDELEAMTRFEVYPNPAESSFYLDWARPDASVFDLAMYNALGQLVRVWRVQPGQRGPFDLSGVSPGMYYLRAGAGRTVKLVVRGR